MMLPGITFFWHGILMVENNFYHGMSFALAYADSMPR